MIRILLVLLVSCYCYAESEVIQDPILNAAEVGRTYYKWVLDINHDGINEILVSLKETPEELEEKKSESPSLFKVDCHGFGVYIGLATGGYVNSRKVIESGQDVAGGIGVDLSQCYVGYVAEVGQYGMVSVETREITAASGKGLPVLKDQIYCYTVEGDHIRRTDLTSLLEDAKKSPIYNEYLSDAKRTRVTLQEISR